MPLTGRNSAEIGILEEELREKLRQAGGSSGNKSLREDLGWEEDLYLAVRKRLLDGGEVALGRGRGGSVRLLESDAETAPCTSTLAVSNSISEKYPRESDLYDPLVRTIRERWIADQPFDRIIAERTDQGGRRADGLWSRPDITIAALTSYTYVPGRHFDLVTFEVKNWTGLTVTAVYEALAHRRAATRSYVIGFVPAEFERDKVDDKIGDILEECTRHGIGFISVGDPLDYDTWETREEAVHVSPDPARMNAFIRSQLSEGTRDEIVRWFRV